MFQSYQGKETPCDARQDLGGRVCGGRKRGVRQFLRDAQTLKPRKSEGRVSQAGDSSAILISRLWFLVVGEYESLELWPWGTKSGNAS